MKYSNYRYIYPPRPKNAIPPDNIDDWDNETLIAQPKLNGSNCVIFTDGYKVKAMNRRGESLSNFILTDEEILKLFKGDTGKWMVINGEYLNKSKLDENGNTFNHKLVIFDLLVLNSDYLIGSTFDQRIKIMEDLFGVNESDKDYLYGISENIYRVKSYSSGFKKLFDKLTSIDIVEGIVMKRIGAKLEIGNTENNNTKSQLKARKGTKNYRY